MWSTIYLVDEHGIQGTAGLFLNNCNRDISIYMTSFFFQYCKYTTASPLADSFYKRPIALASPSVYLNYQYSVRILLQ